MACNDLRALGMDHDHVFQQDLRCYRYPHQSKGLRRGLKLPQPVCNLRSSLMHKDMVLVVQYYCIICNCAVRLYIM